MAELEANFTLNNEQNIDALFEIYASGTTWGNISGNLENQTDLKNTLDTMSGQITNNSNDITSLTNTIQTFGDIVTYNAADFATSAQGALANTALQPGDNITELVNNAGYITAADLPTVNNGKLTINVNGTQIGTFTANQSTDVTANITVPDSATWGNITGTLSNQTDLQNALNAKADTSAIPTVNNNTITIQKNGTTVESFTLNQSSNETINITVPTDTGDLTNGAGFLANNATGTKALAVGDTSQSTAEGGVAIGNGAQANSTYATAVGQNTRASNTNTTVIGRGAKATQARAIAIGSGAEANAQDAIAIKGINNTANTFQVYTYNMLDMATGLIPDARISTNIARTSDMNTADNNLQQQIDAITAASDVTDIVGTYAELQAYDTTSLPPNSIIKVLQDENQNNETTYYRWVITGGVGSWVLIGEEGPYYTIAAANSTFVPQTRTVNNKALSADITLTASDVGALPNSTIIPTVNDATLTIQKNGVDVQTFTANASSNVTANITVPTDTNDLTNGAGYITASDIPTDYYTKSEIDTMVPQPTKAPIVYYQPADSYCYTESNNRFYGSYATEKLYLLQPKTSGTDKVLDMSNTFSLSFTIDYKAAPTSTITLAEIMVSYAAGKGLLLQLNSTGLYYKNNITGTTITGTRALTAGNSYDIKAEYDGTHLIISYKLSSEVNYTQANSTTCTCDGANYNYAAINIDPAYGNLALSSVVLTNGADTLFSYTAGKIALDYDSTLTLNASNQLKIAGSTIYYGTSTTAAATVEKAVSIPAITELNAGQIIVVQPSETSTAANSTIKLNNFTAYPMRYNGAAITTSTDSIVWGATFPSMFIFDGSNWVFLGHGLDSNTTYTINYMNDAGAITAGTGKYAITRYSLVMQKPNGTWEKVTATNATYSTGTAKSVNTSGFLLANGVKYYTTTTTVAGGSTTSSIQSQSASVDMRYSTNCGATPGWASGDIIYFVGTIGADGLFYLDTTTWWTNTLPNSNDGKIYIQLGQYADVYKISLMMNNPAFYHDGTGIKQYIPSTGGGGGATIDDTTPSTTTVYSSQKTQDLINALTNRIIALENNINGGNA